ncbi:hypothetical protein BDV25DRAFT_170932 [Aspergillus avenaceus]|uniref:Uncharacterized protein n=1 Tax=Aspergillus avenaceus TaxID=36643 RepID=A0A5N6U058_ASPAV|nr:hypothetical protein BDV25DRAFT_170932 [Aspergillus avenaceus]
MVNSVINTIQWIFWALFAVAFLLFLIVGMFLPGTARNIVENGSDRKNMTLWQRSWWNSEAAIRVDSVEQDSLALATKNKSNIRIFIVPFRIIFFPDIFLCLWMHGSFYDIDYILAATVSHTFTNICQFNMLFTGLSYLPRGVRIIVGGYYYGRLMDYNYKITARQHNISVRSVSGDHLQEFPIESARSRGSYLLFISTGTLVAYGWTVYYEKHFSIPLILQFI